MNLEFTETQELLRKSTRTFVSTEFPTSRLVELRAAGHGCPQQLWRQLGERGWLGLLIAQEYGGGGAGVLDAVVFLEELGRAPVNGPFLSSTVVTAAIVSDLATAQQRARLLPDLASGERIATLAVTEADGRWTKDGILTTASATTDGYQLNGTKVFVQDGMVATDFLAAARVGSDTDRMGLFWVAADSPGVSVRPLPGFGGLQAEVKLEGVAVGKESCLVYPQADDLEEDGWSRLQKALIRALPAVCAYQVGSCQAMFEHSVQYSRDRSQFGVPIGRFQRVQDHIIRIVNSLDAARWTTYEAAWKLDTGRPAAASAHMAKAVTAEAHAEVANAAHEVHAGIGSDPQYGLTLHTELSRALYGYLGGPRWHKRRMADDLDW